MTDKQPHIKTTTIITITNTTTKKNMPNIANDTDLLTDSCFESIWDSTKIAELTTNITVFNHLRSPLAEWEYSYNHLLDELLFCTNQSGYRLEVRF